MIPYILYVALLLSVCVLFYKILLQSETFYRLNRWVLIACLALSFIIPLISIPQQFTLRSDNTANVANVTTPVSMPVYTIPKDNAGNNPAITQQPSAIKQPSATQVATPTIPSIPFLQRAVKWIWWLYWAGVAVFGLNLLLQVIVLLYQAYTKPFVVDGKYRIVELSGNKAPCSFGNSIFINPSKYDWATYNQILLHEKVHIQQGHSFDILLAELVLVVQWFNPFAWLYRRELENNLEFLTDDSVINSNSVEAASYQLSLLKVSVPNLSLGITTNYNQSLLKKRIVMMNAKRSNINTMWKYFFLVPLLACFMCLFNNTIVHSQIAKNNNGPQKHYAGNEASEGTWFATIKKDKVHIEFRKEEDDHNWSSSTDFATSELSAMPKENDGEFNITREQGTVLFKGRFSGDGGFGHYKFTPNKDYSDFITTQGIKDFEEMDAFFFFTLNVKKDYVKMVMSNGFPNIAKTDLMAMAAMQVDEPYIRMWKNNGFTLEPSQIISAKALKLEGSYVDEIKKAGYPNITLGELLSFKAQHITADYLKGLANSKAGNAMPNAQDVSMYKAMNIDSAYVHSFAALGYKDIPYNQIAGFKQMGVTAEFIKSFMDIGYTDIPLNQIAELKSLNVTPAFITGFNQLGYKNIPLADVWMMKTMQVTPEFVKTFQEAGYKNISLNEITAVKSQGLTLEIVKSYTDLGYKNIPLNEVSTLKAMNVTPEYIKGFQAIGYNDIPITTFIGFKQGEITPAFIEGFKKLGFTDLPVNEMMAFKSMGVTPEYVKAMQDKGFKSKDLHKYFQLKSSFSDTNNK